MLTKLLCEFGATTLMIIFGVGVHCDTVLKGTKYQGSGHMFAITTWSFWHLGLPVCLWRRRVHEPRHGKLASASWAWCRGAAASPS